MPSKTNYLATDAQVASLAKDYVQNASGVESARGTYLKIHLAHALQEIAKGTAKRHTAAETLAAVETTHARLYAVVLEAVTTPDIAKAEDLSPEESRRRAQERNRRSAFARSSRSELANFIKLGGRLLTLTPETVTRDALRQFIRTARAGPASIHDRLEAAVKRTETILREMTEEDADAARNALDDLQHRLQAVVTPPKRMTGRRKVGNITLTAEH